MLLSLLHDCSRLCSNGWVQYAARLAKPHWQQLAGVVGRRPPVNGRHRCSQPRLLASLASTAHPAQLQHDRKPAAAAAPDTDAHANREQQDGASQLQQLPAAPAKPLGHSYPEIEVPGYRISEPPKQKKKKAAPWPTLVRRGQPLPVDPQTWQCAAVLVDKPVGWTSFDVCGKLRGAIRIKKVGHAGTLDPNATGLLIVAIGKGCKRVDSFVAMDKTYSGTMRLGEATPSFDAETEVSTHAEWRHVSDEALQAGAARFLGDSLQLPPMYSAVRIKGQRLYLAARAGETVEREPRPIRLAQFDVWRDTDSDQDVHFRVRCSKGTYIRSLAHDLGEALGSAAHLVALRRETIGEHSVEDAWQLPDLVAAIHEERERLGVPRGDPITSTAQAASV